MHDKRPSGSGALDELENAALVILADKGYPGSAWAKVPYKGRNKPEPQLRAPASEQTRSSRRGEFSASCAAAPGAPGTRQGHLRIAAPRGLRSGRTTSAPRRRQKKVRTQRKAGRSRVPDELYMGRLR